MLWINRVLQGTKTVFPYLVFAILVGEFFITFPLMLYPPAAIGMVLVGIFSMILLVACHRVLSVVVHAVARKVLRKSICPRCEGHTIEMIHHEPSARPIITGDNVHAIAAEPLNGFRCAHCSTIFNATGSVYEPARHPILSVVPA